MSELLLRPRQWIFRVGAIRCLSLQKPNKRQTAKNWGQPRQNMYHLPLSLHRTSITRQGWYKKSQLISSRPWHVTVWQYEDPVLVRLVGEYSHVSRHWPTGWPHIMQISSQFVPGRWHKHNPPPGESLRWLDLNFATWRRWDLCGGVTNMWVLVWLK